MSDINVTPFVDVLLVLLVAFFISAPLLTHSLPIRLPAGKVKGQSPRFEDSMKITVDEKRNIVLNEEVFTFEGLRSQMPLRSDWKDRDRPVLLHIDERVSYGFIVKLMILLKNAGFPRVGLVFQEQGS